MQHIAITTDSPLWPGEQDTRPVIERAIHVAQAHTGGWSGDTELSVLLTDDHAIAGLNAQWRGQSKPTNVLSFPAPALPSTATGTALILGDIVVAYETVAREADVDGKGFHAHFTHLIVHGFLHLLGYDHQEDEDAARMEGLESAILAELGIADPYAPTSEALNDDGQSTT